LAAASIRQSRTGNDLDYGRKRFGKSKVSCATYFDFLTYFFRAELALNFIKIRKSKRAPKSNSNLITCIDCPAEPEGRLYGEYLVFA
jgi:hypothetical protein